jgi:hypothetical protein
MLSIALDESSRVGDVVFTAAIWQPVRLCAFQSYSDCGALCQVGEYESPLSARSVSDDEVVWQQWFKNTRQVLRSGEARSEVWDFHEDLEELEAYEPFALIISSIDHRRDRIEATISLGRQH